MSNDHVEEAVKRRLSVFRQNDVATTIQAVEELAVLGKAAVSILIEALSDQNAKVREGVAKALGKIRDPRAAPALERALRNEQLAPENEEGDDTDARVEAALALGAIGASSAFEPLTAMLAEALETDWTLSWYIIDALGMLGDTRAIPLLVDALEHSDFDVQKSAMYALVSFGQVAVEPLIKLLRDRRDEVVLQAVQALGKLGAAQAVPELTWLQSHCEDRFLKDFIKSYVAESIRKIDEHRTE